MASSSGIGGDREVVGVNGERWVKEQKLSESKSIDGL
jgi:hypothetical protein